MKGERIMRCIDVPRLAATLALAACATATPPPLPPAAKTEPAAPSPLGAGAPEVASPLS